jgi:hypothetical protein
MQILLNTDPHIDGREAMHDHLESVVIEVLGPFGNRIVCVEAYLTDTNGASKAVPTNVCCTLEAQMVGSEPVVAQHHASTANQAIHGALRKLGRVIAREFKQQNHRCAFPPRIYAGFVKDQQSDIAPL